jgi:hypothetical protein
MRVARDVTVTCTAGGMVATSKEPSIVGDAVTIEMVVDGQVERVAARVEESRPIVVAGTIWHRIRLSRVDANG